MWTSKRHYQRWICPQSCSGVLDAENIERFLSLPCPSRPTTESQAGQQWRTFYYNDLKESYQNEKDQEKLAT
jgi:hypothetical protein